MQKINTCTSSRIEDSIKIPETIFAAILKQRQADVQVGIGKFLLKDITEKNIPILVQKINTCTSSSRIEDSMKILIMFYERKPIPNIKVYSLMPIESVHGKCKAVT